MNRTPYELRSEILKLSQEHLHKQYEETTKNAPEPIRKTIPYPSIGQIMQHAEIMLKFMEGNSQPSINNQSTMRKSNTDT